MSSCSQSNPIDLETSSRVAPMAMSGLEITQSTLDAEIVGSWIIEHDDPDPIGSINRLLTSHSAHEPSSESGWLIMLSYELGRAIEPKARHARQASEDQNTQCDSKCDSQSDIAPPFPLAVVQRWQVSDESAQDSLDSDPYTLGPIESSMGKAGYIAAVERAQDYIRAGDIYQANIAHHLIASFSGSARTCFAELSKAADPRLGSMIGFEYQGTRHAVLSISPELFVEYDPDSGVIRTEPMKGTRPIGADAAELRESIKDRAELDMITDLMRNDLGRVCRLGSVKVVDPRRIEAHGSGVLQASAAIEGSLAADVGFGEIISATFPPGSVTGAPKVRAMQVIDELESRQRKSYCGSMIVLDDRGAIKGSVSIRTAHIWGEIDPDSPDRIHNGRFVYPVGAGVVADSDPESEWAETLIKATVLRSALGIDIGD